MRTSDYAYETPGGDLRTFETEIEAVNAAGGNADESGESITVYEPDGTVVKVVEPMSSVEYATKEAAAQAAKET